MDGDAASRPAPKRFRMAFLIPLVVVSAAAWFLRDSIRDSLASLRTEGLGNSETVAHSTREAFNGFDVSNAIIPTREILSGGPGRDGIPSIDQPKFIRPNAADFMLPDDLVVSVTIGEQTRAYPIRVLVWHEIVNDELGGQPIAVTYCPLCGTAMVFSRRVGERTLTFGVSGMLFQSDVLMYDRQTESLWSQLAMKCVSGAQVNTPLEWLPSEHLTWSAWKLKFPTGEVLSTGTGAQRNYSGEAYAGYEENPETMFPVPAHRIDLPKKEWVVGVMVDGAARAYPIRSLPANQTVTDPAADIAIEITFDPISQQAIVRRKTSGEVLPNVKVYWFAWQAFYPQTTLWKP